MQNHPTYGSIISSNISSMEHKIMHAQKLSISLPYDEVAFIETYQKLHHLKTRSEVIKEALRVLQQTQLEACYQEANHEIDTSFEICDSDGIDEHETW